MDLSINGKVNDYNHFENNSKYAIDFFRIAPFKLKELNTYKCAMRAILINSFAFLIIVFEENISEHEIEEIEEIIKSKYRNLLKIEGNNKIKLTKDKNFWENSLYTNVALQDKFLNKRDVKNDKDTLYLINISKDEIIEKDYTQLREFIVSKSLNKQSVKENYQKYIVSISGYDRDERELYCIPEFQEYIRKIIYEFPEIIWFIHLELGIFEAMFLAYINVRTLSNNTIAIDNKKGVNNLLNKFALDNSNIGKITGLIEETILGILSARGIKKEHY
ncbi:MAG: hypothetical protein HEEMFOPI_02004 [Holosporales bacterium]